MMIHERERVQVLSGPCGECGLVTTGLMESVDCITRSSVGLCPFCWVLHRQRQVFSGGCCGELG